MNIPQKFSLQLNNISKIGIFNGNTDHGVTIQDDDELKEIIDNLNGVSMKCKEISFLKMGYRLKISIYNKKGKERESFIINGEDTS